MKIIPVDALAGLRAALSAPESEQAAAFEAGVMEPLRPFWEPFVGFMRRGQPQGAETSPPSALEVARMIRIYRPELGVARGLEGLAELERAGAWPACALALERSVEALRPEEHGIGLEEVRLTLALADPDGMDGRTDLYTGVGNTPGQVFVMAWPTAFNLPRLKAIVPHEFNHNVRFLFEPFTPDTTVGQYIVAEGLGEAFADEVCGRGLLGRWATTLQGDELRAVLPRFREGLHVKGFDEIRGYIFGDWSATQFGHKAHGLPDFAGYAVGYRLVRAYLAKTGKSAAEATYVPWEEIVTESRYLV